MEDEKRIEKIEIEMKIEMIDENSTWAERLEAGFNMVGESAQVNVEVNC